MTRNTLFLDILQEHLTFGNPPTIDIFIHDIIQKYYKMNDEEKKRSYFYTITFGEGDTIQVVDNIGLSHDKLLELIKVDFMKHSNHFEKHILNNYNDIIQRRENYNRFLFYKPGPDYYENILNYLPRYRFYNLLGDDAHFLTDYFLALRNHLASQIVKTVLITPLSLKKLCLNSLSSEDLENVKWMV